MDRRTALVAVVVSAGCYATLAVLTRLAYDAGMQPLPLLAWRFAIAAALIAGVQALRQPAALKVSTRDVGRFALLALAGYGMGSVCFFFALKHADASIVAVLLYAYPTLVALAEMLFAGRRLDRGRSLALAATFSGCLLVLDPFRGSVSWLGMTLGLAAAVGYAAFSFLSARWIGGRSRMTVVSYVFFFSALIAAGAALVSGGSLSPAGWAPQAWLLLGLIVAVPTFAAVVLYLDGVRRMGAAQAAMVSSFEPLFTIALAAVVLGERMGIWQWAGALLVVAGVFVGEAGERRPAEHAPV